MKQATEYELIEKDEFDKLIAGHEKDGVANLAGGGGLKLWTQYHNSEKFIAARVAWLGSGNMGYYKAVEWEE